MKKLQIEDFEKVYKDRAPETQGPYLFFSVMVPLVERDGELCLLYEVRSEDLRTQPGQICFPGGRMEAGETPEQCAIRETCEELGLASEHIRVIAQLDYIHTYSNFTMYPFLGVIDYEICRQTMANEDEVKEIFFVPLSWFLENRPVVFDLEVVPKVPEDFPYETIDSTEEYKWRKGKTAIPVYRYENYAIWGLTASITQHLLEVVCSCLSGETPFVE